MLKITIPFCIGLCFIVLSSAKLNSQSIAVDTLRIDSLDTKITKVNIKNSDFFRRSLDSLNNEIKNFIGNVVVQYDSTLFYCNQAELLNDTLLHAIGQVSIVESDSLSIFCEFLQFNSQTDIALLSEKVILDYNGQLLQTAQLEYDLSNRRAAYYNGGSLKKNSVTLHSQQCIYDIDKEMAFFRSDISVVDTSFVLYNDSLNYNLSTEKAEFYGPTRAVQNGGNIYCESGYYLIPERYALFADNAQYVKDSLIASADQMYYDGELGDFVLEGNAKYREGDKNAKAVRIVYNELKEVTHLTGFAEYYDGDKIIKADRIIYDQINDGLISEGRSEITDRQYMISANAINFDQEENAQILIGDVIWIDTIEKIDLHADTMITYRIDDTFKAFGSDKQPILKKTFENDTILLVADTIFYGANGTMEIEPLVQDTMPDLDSMVIKTIPNLVINDSIPTDSASMAFNNAKIDSIDRPVAKKLYAYPNASVINAQYQAIAGKVEYNQEDSLFILYKNPIFWADSVQFKGDNIQFELGDSGVKSMTINQNSIMISESHPAGLYDQVQGKTMLLHFENDSLRRMDVNSNAESIYFIKDNDEKYVGMDKTKSSQIAFLFDNNELKLTKYLTTPESDFTPIELVDFKSVNFPGFEWRIFDKPNHEVYFAKYMNEL